jgi:phage terminase small subunit
MSKKNTKIDTLSPESRALYDRLVDEWRIVDSAGSCTLMVAMQALDRLHEAQALIASEGLMITDRFGQKKAHPATTVEREARAGLMQCFKALNLDLESLEEEPDAEA